MTQHTYFNLRGDGKIYDHTIILNADKYTPVNENLIPTGEVLPVENTPFDLRKETKMGEGIEKLKDSMTKGYDNNFVLNSDFVAKVHEPDKGITMEVYTTQPGVQFYTGNNLTGVKGKRVGYMTPTRDFALRHSIFQTHQTIPTFQTLFYVPVSYTNIQPYSNSYKKLS